MKTYVREFSERPGYLSEQLFFERFHGGADGPVLEIGCSVGHMMRYGSGRKIGIDIDADALRIAREKGFPVAQMDLQNGIAFRSDSFASIDCQHVIEHVPDPLFLMKECHRVLRPGGKVVVVTPNVRAIGFDFYVDYTHIRPFTAESLRRIAFDAGFAESDVRYQYVGVPLTKLLHTRGLLSLQGALRLQSFFYRFGMKLRDALILVARK